MSCELEELCVLWSKQFLQGAFIVISDKDLNCVHVVITNGFLNSVLSPSCLFNMVVPSIPLWKSWEGCFLLHKTLNRAELLFMLGLEILFQKVVNLFFAAVLEQNKWNWYLLVNNLVDFSVLSSRSFLLKVRLTFSYFGLVFIFQPKVSKDIRMDAYHSYMKCNIWEL